MRGYFLWGKTRPRKLGASLFFGKTTRSNYIDQTKRFLLRERSRKRPPKSRCDLPAAGKESELESVVKAIAAGGAEAVAAGFPAMANPSAAEVATALTRWIEE